MVDGRNTKKALDYTRGNGNTSVLLGLTLINPKVKLVVDNKFDRDSFRKQGYLGVILVEEAGLDDILVFDNGYIYGICK